jgi:hypothetical protein
LWVADEFYCEQILSDHLPLRHDSSPLPKFVRSKLQTILPPSGDALRHFNDGRNPNVFAMGKVIAQLGQGLPRDGQMSLINAVKGED